MNQDDFENALGDALLMALFRDVMYGDSPILVIEVGDLGGLFGSPFDKPPHVHECEPCKYEWTHDTQNLTNPEEYENAHKCPKCGAIVRQVKRFLPEPREQD